MTSHPDTEALAFFAEGLTDPDEENSVAAHIETCAKCAATLEELSGVTRVLGEAPVPALPQGVADLLDSRIAEAVRERSPSAAGTGATAPSEPAVQTTGEPVPPVPDAPAPVIPIADRRRGFGLPKLMAAAAAAVFVVGGGAAIVNGLMVGETENDAAAPMYQEDSQPESAPDIAQSYSAESTASGTVYTEDQLGAQAAEVLADSEDTAEGMGAQAQKPVTAPVQGCVDRFEEANDVRGTLVDEALFDSGDGAERVWVLFTQDTGGDGVVVLDPRCAQGGDIDTSVLAEADL
ncbi:anti-sigma factor family protein [Nocardiopsis terrae]